MAKSEEAKDEQIIAISRRPMALTVLLALAMCHYGR